MSTSIAQQEAFRAERLKFLGGSDVANLFNLEPYYCKRRLFNIKTGAQADAAFWGNRATERGTLLEPIAAQRYAEETGREVRRAHPKTDPVFPILRPQPDYEIINNDRGPGIVSLKVPGREVFIRIKRAVEVMTDTSAADNDRISEWRKSQIEAGKKILLPYELQIQAELGSQKREWGSFGVMWAENLDVVSFDRDKDDYLIKEIRAEAKAFWTEHIELNDPPARLDPDSKQCSKCEFRVSCQSEHLLKMLQKEEKGGDIMTLPTIPVLDSLVADLRDKQEILEEATALVDEVKDQIRVMLSDADGGEGLNVRCWNKLQAGRSTLQKDPLLKFLGETEKSALKVQEKLQKGEITVTPDVALFVSLLTTLRQDVETKFVKTGAPFRTLRIYDLVKK